MLWLALLQPAEAIGPVQPSSFNIGAATALVGALVILLPLLFSGIVSVITALKVAKIEAHVNSEKTALEGKLALALREGELLRELGAEKKQTAALLAQAASRTTTEIIQAKAQTAPAATTEKPMPVEIVGAPATVPVDIVEKPKP